MTYRKGQQVHVRFDMRVPANCTKKELLDYLLFEFGALETIESSNPCLASIIEADFMSVEVYP